MSYPLGVEPLRQCRCRHSSGYESASVKVGDKVEITYTEALAISVEKAKKKS